MLITPLQSDWPRLRAAIRASTRNLGMFISAIFLTVADKSFSRISLGRGFYFPAAPRRNGSVILALFSPSKLRLFLLRV